MPDRETVEKLTFRGVLTEVTLTPDWPVGLYQIRANGEWGTAFVFGQADYVFLVEVKEQRGTSVGGTA
jgi:hypothetical protein